MNYGDVVNRRHTVLYPNVWAVGKDPQRDIRVSRDFQCEHGRRHIHAILYRVDAFSGYFCQLRQLLLSEASGFARGLEVVQ